MEAFSCGIILIVVLIAKLMSEATNSKGSMKGVDKVKA